MDILIQKYQRVSSKSVGIGSFRVKRRNSRRSFSIKEDNTGVVPDELIEVLGNQCAIFREKKGLILYCAFNKVLRTRISLKT